MTKLAHLQKRIRKAQKLLRSEDKSSVALISSTPTPTRSNDTHYRYRQGSDLLYFTDLERPNTLLLLSSKEEPVLITQRQSELSKVWEGPQKSLRLVAKALGVEFIEVDNPQGAAWKKLNGHDQLFFEPRTSAIGMKLAQKAFETPAAGRGKFPHQFTHLDRFSAKLRIKKDKTEIAHIQRAVDVTIESIKNTLLLMRPGISEAEIAHTLEYNFRMHGCEVAFTTIAAAGKSAATLHYEDYTAKLKRNELLMLDCGAEYRGYAADITRAFPVSGTFTEPLAHVYEIVLEAQKAAISKVKDGVRIKTLYDAAAKALTEGLKELGVLRGKTSALLEKKAYRPYFPHGIGHSLGLDVHDVGDLRNNTSPKLEAGMVFTVEPGLYFPKRKGNAPACGVRIEDDVYVTKSGCKILTKNCPKEIDEVEAFVAEIKGQL